MSAIIGILVAVGLAIKTYWYKLKRLFVGNKISSDDSLASNNQKSKEVEES
jgi:hypothetical protein